MFTFSFSIHICDFLSEERVEDQELIRKVDIGFPKLRASRATLLQDRIGQIKAQRSNPELEKLARQQKCKNRSLIASCVLTHSLIF